MYEGRIIKFYREKYGMTQEQLGLGICSTTHISKIERGLTEYSPEITSLLAKRLHIHMEQELDKLKNIKEKLDLWHEMIIALNMEAASKIYSELANNELIEISNYHALYQLLTLKYHIRQGNSADIKRELSVIAKEYERLPPFEQNLYKHVVGIYELFMNNYAKSIQVLKSIHFDDYSNALVYYDLATAYHCNNLPILAYYYAEKALLLYKQKNNFLGIIDTENLMIIQLESGQHRDFKETAEHFEELIKICDLCHAPDKKAKLLHNFAYECLRREKYKMALDLYNESMQLKEKYTGIYLLSLEGYIRAGLEGNLLSREALLENVHEGLEIAGVTKDRLYSFILHLHKYSLMGREKRYYQYLTEKALPFFKNKDTSSLLRNMKRNCFPITSEQAKKIKHCKLLRQ
ncbi:helix-turn-helix domain-containing protein [Paracerasibacillus soli]|uniref:Helix-turn-helix transcriptional regulator n=1 Tax=Paracerasibacillus soli TaxID=480284 RepID=A0ABU5CWE9_9BACI|nr:helix-turn-helix transcriptional regulator [Virgibacillus soli]MDY0410186.1 helix-turn-helix transcriptional regulator [Virgibacillus soli]